MPPSLAMAKTNFCRLDYCKAHQKYAKKCIKETSRSAMTHHMAIFSEKPRQALFMR